MSSLASRCDLYSADSTTEIMARPSANLRINDFFKKTSFMEKKGRNPLKRCLEKQSNIGKALTGSCSLKGREAIEKPKFPDPSNLLIYYSSSSRLQRTILFPKHIVPKGELKRFVMQHSGNSGMRRLIHHKKATPTMDKYDTKEA